jgi:hypothetical protein
MTPGAIETVCAVALEQRWLLSQAGKAPDDRTPYAEWLEREESKRHVDTRRQVLGV